MQRRKVLFVITKSNWGGAQRYVYDLATHLPADYEVVVAAGGDGLLFKKLKGAGIRTIPVPGLERDISFIKEWRVLGELVRLFHTEHPNVVHLNSSKIGGLGALAGRIAGVQRIIYTAHGWAYHEKVSVISKTFRWLASLATILLCTRTITVSRFDQRTAPLGLRTTMIHNGIPLPFALGSGEKVRSAFPPGTTITGTIGELTKNKNQRQLIEDARRDPALHIAIIGEGEDRPMLEACIKEYGLEGRVKLFGFLPAAEVLKGFGCFTLPSLKEGLPYVLLEARAAGLPISASRVGGIPDILDSTDPQDFSFDRMLKETLAVYNT